MTLRATPAVSRKAWALKAARAPLVLGFLIFIFNSKHPDVVALRGISTLTSFAFARLCKTEQRVAWNIPTIIRQRIPRLTTATSIRQWHRGKDQRSTIHGRPVLVRWPPSELLNAI